MRGKRDLTPPHPLPQEPQPHGSLHTTPSKYWGPRRKGGHGTLEATPNRRSFQLGHVRTSNPRLGSASGGGNAALAPLSRGMRCSHGPSLASARRWRLHLCAWKACPDRRVANGPPCVCDEPHGRKVTHGCCEGPSVLSLDPRRRSYIKAGQSRLLSTSCFIDSLLVDHPF